MTYKLKLSAEAQTTIEEQLQWYEADEKHGGAALAKRWLDKLETELATLTNMPGKHGFAPENGLWRPEIALCQMRFQPWKSKAGWRVLFAINEEDHVVTVLQVRHEHRRWLFEEEPN